MSDHPIVANAAFGLQPENLSQFAGRRLPPVIVLCPGRWAGKASVVLRQVLVFQILVRGIVAGDLLPPQFLYPPTLLVPPAPPYPPLSSSPPPPHSPSSP